MQVSELIVRHQLSPHPEGGWYREVHRSAMTVTRADGVSRTSITVILILLEAGAVSCWHRVSGADETWHFVDGAELELLILPPAGGQLQRRRLGPQENSGVVEPFLVVPAGHWQAARSLGAWTLVSCCVGPGFEFDDFSLMRDQPQAERPVGALAEFL